MIEEATILRFGDHPILGCPGDLFVGDKRYCSTLEPPWNPIENGKGGKPYESCVPVGEYQLKKHHSKEWGDCFIMINTALDVFRYEEDMIHKNQRFACLFGHRGSYVKNFVGCVGLGRKYQLVDDEMGITSTRITCEKLMHLFYQEGLKKLIIRWKH